MLLRNSPARQRPSLLRYRILDDFKNGMMGSERLKNDSGVSIINLPTVSAWGLTETSPLATDCHFQTERSGHFVHTQHHRQLARLVTDMGVLDDLVAPRRDPKKEPQRRDGLADGRRSD